MPSYSTHDDLKQLHEDIDELTSKISDLVFYGNGPNDMTPIIIPERNIITAASVVKFWIQIKTVGMTVNKFHWSDVGDALSWTGENVIITSEVQHLNHGIGIEFAGSFGHVLDDYWRFDLNPPDSSDERAMAYGWINDRLKQHIDTPLSSPTQTIVLAEANFAVSLILRAKKRPTLVEDFRDEAVRLIDEILEIPTKPIEPTIEPVTD